MDGVPHSVRVGAELALTAHVMQGGVKYEWHGEWATGNELHNSPELKALMCKSEELVARAGRGMTHGKRKNRWPGVGTRTHGHDKRLTGIFSENMQAFHSMTMPVVVRIHYIIFVVVGSRFAATVFCWERGMLRVLPMQKTWISSNTCCATTLQFCAFRKGIGGRPPYFMTDAGFLLIFVSVSSHLFPRHESHPGPHSPHRQCAHERAAPFGAPLLPSASSAAASARSKTPAKRMASASARIAGMLQVPSTALQTARWTATARMLHQRRAHPCAAAARKAVGARR